MIAIAAVLVWFLTVSTVLEVLEPQLLASGHPTLMVLGVCVGLVVAGHLIGDALKSHSRLASLCLKLSGWVFLVVTVSAGLGMPLV